MVTRSLLAAFALASVALVAGCSGGDDIAARRPAAKTPDGKSPTDPTNPGGTSTTPGVVSAAVTACQAVAAPTSLDDAKDASELSIAGTAVFYRSGQVVKRVLKNGSNKKTIFTSPNLNHAFADKKGLLLVEQTDDGNPNATLRTFAATAPADGAADPAFPEFPVVDGAEPGGTTAATNFSAASMKIFGADDDNFYAQADDADGNGLIVSINRTTLAQTNLVTNAAADGKVISSPQRANGAIWWVENNARIFKVALATDDDAAGTPGEVFGLGPQCNLAVSETTAYCSLGGTVESRSLTGGDPKTVVTAAQTKSAGGLLGFPKYAQGKLYFSGNDPDVKMFIRSFATSGEESFVACKRGAIRDLAVDDTNIVWAEEGAGIFVGSK